VYEYRAHCVRVVDGDTYDIEVDLGFSIRYQIRVRLKDIDTAELNAKSAAERQHADEARILATRLLTSMPLTIRTEKDRIGIYGRYTASVTLPDGTDLAQRLRDAGMEKKATYPENNS
jgi:micrococcal nuclease